MRKIMTALAIVVGMTVAMAIPAMACTSYYVGSDCTADGSIMYGRTEDLKSYGDKVFKVIPAEEVGENAVYTDTTGATNFSGPIKVTKTYRYTVVRDCIEAADGFFGEAGENELGVSMSATTSASASRNVTKFDTYVRGTGITEENLVDYILCQASSARDGVEILANVIDTIGAGEGNGLFIADQNEVWYFEMLTGHNYCAIKLPKDKAAIIPNCLVIGDVDLTDTENVIASKNLVSLAKENGFYVEAVNQGDINVKLSYVGNGYSAGNADRIRGGQYLLSGNDNEAIYTDNFQDMFFTCADITVEKLYELAGYRYEGMNFGERKISRMIGVPSSMECHIFQIRPNMPAELATVEWLCMNSADLSVFVPFYTAAMTDTSDSYKMEAYSYNDDSAYWAFRAVSVLANANRSRYADAIKNFYKTYMTKLEAAQSTVDAQMMEIYKKNPELVQYYATQLGIAIGEKTIGYSKRLKGAILFDMARYDQSSNPRAFSLNVNSDDFVYDISMVKEPQEETTEEITTSGNEEISSEVETTGVKAPKKVKFAKIPAKKLFSKKVKLSIKKIKNVAGYTVQISKSKKFTDKQVLVKKNVKKVSVTISSKKLKNKKKLYVRVRAYKVDAYGNKIYGKWSGVKRIKVKK